MNSILTGGMPSCGIATFAGYPLRNKKDRADGVILGVPYDEAVTYRPGTRMGPRAVRCASMFYNYESETSRFYDSNRRKPILKGKKIVDAGDINIEPLNLEKNFRLITESVLSIINSSAVPCIIGGDHSITFPVFSAFEGRKVHYLHLDSHVDCDGNFKNSFTHGSPVSNIIKKKLAQSVTIIGVRGLTNSEADILWAEKNGAHIITAMEMRKILRKGGSPAFQKGDYYISLDIDFFDPAAAPGTGTPEPGGFFFSDFSEIIDMISKSGNIIGCDVTEVNPLLDNKGDITSHLAARSIIELLSAALSSNGAGNLSHSLPPDASTKNGNKKY